MRILFLLILSVLIACQPTEPDSGMLRKQADFAKIDIHSHYRSAPAYLKPLLEEWNMHTQLVDVYRENGEGVERSWPYYQQVEARFPETFFLCTAFNAYGIDEPDFASRIIARLEQEIAAGAGMVKVWKNIGMVDQDRAGNYVQIDDPRFQPIWDFLIAKNIPVMAHLAEPLQAWRPLEEGNPHYNYFRDHPQYHAYLHPEIPRYETIIEARDHWLAQNPQLTVLGAHMGSMSHDVEMVAERLDKYPNFFVEPAARFGDLTRQDADRVRAFFIQYQDRILYGTDLGSDGPSIEKSAEDLASEEKYLRKMLEIQWIWLSGRDSLYYDSPMISFPVNTHSLTLPDSVLRKVYHDNAVQLLGKAG